MTERKNEQITEGAEFHNDQALVTKVPQHEHTASMHPDAALATLLAESNKHAPVSQRIPRLKMTAFVLIGLVLFSAFQALLMGSVILSLGNIGEENRFLLSRLPWGGSSL